MKHYQILAHCTEEELSKLALLVLQSYSASQVKFLSGPRQGLVMLRMQESVADSQFNAGEILVTEVKLELDGQFGFGTVIGDSFRRATAVALVDAALRKSGPLAQELDGELAELARALQARREKLYQLVATSKVAFDVM